MEGLEISKFEIIPVLPTGKLSGSSRGKKITGVLKYLERVLLRRNVILLKI